MVLYWEITPRFQTNYVSTVMTGSYSEDRPSEVAWQIRRGVVKKQHVKVCKDTLFLCILCFILMNIMLLNAVHVIYGVV